MLMMRGKIFNFLAVWGLWGIFLSVSAAQEAADTASTEAQTGQAEAPVQSGPFIDLFGTELYKLEILDESTAQINSNYTNEALAGKKVIGLYFSADWCGPVSSCGSNTCRLEKEPCV